MCVRVRPRYLSERPQNQKSFQTPHLHTKRELVISTTPNAAFVHQLHVTVLWRAFGARLLGGGVESLGRNEPANTCTHGRLGFDMNKVIYRVLDELAVKCGLNNKWSRVSGTVWQQCIMGPVQGGSIEVTVNLKMYWKSIPVSGVCVTRDSFAGRLTLLLWVKVVSISFTASIYEVSTALIGHIVVKPWECCSTRTDLHG